MNGRGSRDLSESTTKLAPEARERDYVKRRFGFRVGITAAAGRACCAPLSALAWSFRAGRNVNAGQGRGNQSVLGIEAVAVSPEPVQASGAGVQSSGVALLSALPFAAAHLLDDPRHGLLASSFTAVSVLTLGLRHRRSRDGRDLHYGRHYGRRRRRAGDRS